MRVGAAPEPRPRLAPHRLGKAPQNQHQYEAPVVVVVVDNMADNMAGMVAGNMVRHRDLY
jgi:hypothetical protein